MRRSPRYGMYILMTAVILLFCFISVGYSSWADSLQVNGSVTLATPAPTSTQGPSPAGFSDADPGYEHWSNQPFDSPVWTYYYDYDNDIGRVQGTINPVIRWVGNTMYVTGTVFVPYHDYRGQKMLVDFISDVGVATRYHNTSGKELHFATARTDNPLVQDFVCLGNMNYSKTSLSLPNGDSMVISSFSDANWVLSEAGLDLTDRPGLVYTESKQTAFTISDGIQSNRYDIVFELTIYTSLSPTEVPASTTPPPPTPTPAVTLDNLNVQESNVAYMDAYDTRSAPYWIYQSNYDPNSQYKSGEAVPSSSFANGKLTIPMRVVYPQTAKKVTNFKSIVRGALKFTNNTGQNVELEITSADSGLYAKLVKPQTAVIQRGETYVLPAGQTVFATLYSDYNSWAFDNVNLNGPPEVKEKNAVVRARIPGTGIYRDYTVAFVLTLEKGTSAMMSLGGTGTPVFGPDAGGDGIVSDGEDTSEQGEDKTLEMEASPLPPSTSNESTGEEEAASIEEDPAQVTPPPDLPSLPNANLAKAGYEDKASVKFDVPYWNYSLNNREGQSTEKKLTPAPYWEKDTLIVYANVFIPQAGIAGEPLLKSFDSQTGIALEFANITGVDLEFSRVSISRGLEHSFVLAGSSVSQQNSVLVPAGKTMVVSTFVKDMWPVEADGLDLENRPGMNHLEEKEMAFKVTNTVTGQSKTYTLRFVLSLQTEEPLAAPTPTETPVPTETPMPTETPSPTLTPPPILAVTPAPMMAPTETPSPTLIPTPTPTVMPAPVTALTETPAPVPTPAPTPAPTLAETSTPAATLAGTAAPEATLPAAGQSLTLEMAPATSPVTPSPAPTPTSEPVPEPTPAPTPAPVPTSEDTGTEDAGTGGS